MPLERSTILSALAHNSGDITKAARELGCSRRTLQHRMREYGMPRGRAGRRKRRLPYGRVRGLGLLAGAAALVGVGVWAVKRRGSPA